VLLDPSVEVDGLERAHDVVLQVRLSRCT
jgi:hypothetical protein